MTRRVFAALLASGVLATFGHATLDAQLSPTAEWAVHAQNQYQVLANVTYLTANGFEAKLDVYRRRDVQTPQPTLVFYHGGGWIGGTKESSFMSLMPWLEMGWNVVNVEYRMARVSLAPAAAWLPAASWRCRRFRATRGSGPSNRRLMTTPHAAWNRADGSRTAPPSPRSATRCCLPNREN